MRTPRLLLWALLLSTLTFAQDPGLQRVVSEAHRLPIYDAGKDPGFFPGLRRYERNLLPLHQALRDWVESRLPQSLAQLATISAIDRAITRDLAAAGFREETGDRHDIRPGLPMASIKHLREDPNKVLVTADVTVPCGVYSFAYLYDYSTGSRRRILEDRPTREHDESVNNIRVSPPGTHAGQLIVVFRSAVQCGSSWGRLSYHLATWSPSENVARRALDAEHDIWFGAEHPYQARLAVDDLLLEIRSWSFDGRMGDRAHVLHYHLSNGLFPRVDPVALRPQDFVDEWLTRPWSEMASRTVDPIAMGPWHQRITHLLEPTEISGHFYVVQPCPVSGLWQIGIVIKKKYIEIGTAWFLVQSRPGYHFLMKSVGLERQPGCPGEASPDFGPGPSLFPVSSRK